MEIKLIEKVWETGVRLTAKIGERIYETQVESEKLDREQDKLTARRFLMRTITTDYPNAVLEKECIKF